MFGYIYITTNLITYIKYIGKHKSNKFDFNNYKGSGKVLKKAFKKYGKENFKCELLTSINGVPTICESEDELNSSEEFYIDYYDCVMSDQFYNLVPGGSGGCAFSNLPLETQNKLREIRSINSKKFWDAKDETERHEFYQKVKTTIDKKSPQEKEELNKRNSEAQKKFWNSLSEDEKQKRRDNLKVAHSLISEEKELERKRKERETKDNWSEERKLEYSKKLSVAALGKKRYTNGEITISVFPDEVPEGFYLGGANKNKYKFVFIFNGVIFNGYTELLNELKNDYPTITKRNIETIIDNTKRAQKNFPGLINKIIRYTREEFDENKINIENNIK